MITVKNLRDLLNCLGFQKNGEVYTKYYDASLMKCISVDFVREEICWPDGLRHESGTTSNFGAPENFVVLECVDRLLAKGYRPEHLILEETFPLGHTSSGGRADISVLDPEGNHLVIIECKTAGNEFQKFRRQLFEDGGQLFSYWHNRPENKWLCLYASDLVKNEKQETRVDYSNSIVVLNCSDDPNIEKTAARDESMHLYKEAVSSPERRFEVWRDTYNCQTCPDVIFGADSQAYNIGFRRIRKGELLDVAKESGIVNKFLEILRHNNVSDLENAFNKLVSLFICKLVDELSKDDGEETDFQYRVGSDDYETLQDRLQRLHRKGMREFMDEEIFYVENDYADKLFAQYKGSERRNAIHDLRETIRKLKFYSNNEFAFKDVHNEELFYQNGKILVEMVQLFERYRIVYPARDQLLGDMFEQLLNKGFKQNEGQFFTAMPISHFIWDSLPLNRFVNRGKKFHYPRVVDYACGAGHFLTEGVEAINACVASRSGDGKQDNSWVEKFIYGVEKDYRLARVSKVSLHMNGAGKGQIIFGDGLDNYPEKGIKCGMFDVLVANPPYHIEEFKSHLRLKNNKLALLDEITNQGTEIEALFVERIAQLLKPGGVAAVILPSSILTDGCRPYTGARKSILDEFRVRAIVSLPKNAFQATNTETVILFLEKYLSPPRRADMIADSVSAILRGERTRKGGDEWEDAEILNAYLTQIGVSGGEYCRFISAHESWTKWLGHAAFGAYAKEFDKSGIARQLRSKKYFKESSAKEQDAYLTKSFYSYALQMEREKLQVFGEVYQQKTLIVKSPDDKDEERRFLGYSWSNRRGAEGIQDEKNGGMLYDPHDRNAEGTIASGVRAVFNGETPKVMRGNEYVVVANLKDMIDFSRTKFEAQISLAVSEQKELDSVYPMESIGSVADLVRGVTYAKGDQVSHETARVILTADNVTMDGVFWVQKKVYLRDDFDIAPEKILRKGDVFVCFSSGSRQHIGKVAYISEDTEYAAGGFMGILRAKTGRVLPKYLYEVLNAPEMRDIVRAASTGSNIKNLSESLSDIKIPIPPLAEQKKIVAECAEVDDAVAQQRRVIEKRQESYDKLFSAQEVAGELVSLGDVAMYGKSRVPFTSIDSSDYVTTDNLLQKKAGVVPYVGSIIKGSVVEYKRGDVLISNIRPYLQKIWFADKTAGCSPDVLVFRVCDPERITPAFLNGILRRDDFFDFMMQGKSGVKMPRGDKQQIMKYRFHLPPIDKQERVTARAEVIRQEIVLAKKLISGAMDKKTAVLNKYLR